MGHLDIQDDYPKWVLEIKASTFTFNDDWLLLMKIKSLVLQIPHEFPAPDITGGH